MIVTHFDTNLIYKECSSLEDLALLLGPNIPSHLIGQSVYSINLNQNLTKNKNYFAEQNRIVLERRESLVILDFHFYENGPQVVLTTKRPILSNINGPNKVLGGSIFTLPSPIFDPLEVRGLLRRKNLVVTIPVLQNLFFYVENYIKKYHLSNREIQILQGISCGKSYQIISEQLNLSRRTIENYMENVKNKLCASRKEDVLSCLEKDLDYFHLLQDLQLYS